jgi:hypothetical protein
MFQTLATQGRLGELRSRAVSLGIGEYQILGGCPASQAFAMVIKPQTYGGTWRDFGKFNVS